MTQVIITMLAGLLLAWLLSGIPEPHNHFEGEVKALNVKLQTRPLLCTFYGDTVQVMRDTGKHIPL